ncbi:MAG: hypothetical protein NVS3B7_20180 [Candidatus Elarobacter sp.]
MRPWQNGIALIGALLAAAALLPLPDRLRIAFAGLACAAIVVLLAVRMRAHRARRAARRVSDVYGRIEIIRAQRDRGRARGPR